MVPGELCLGGNQLADGYLNLLEKTRDVFIDNPFGAGRLYRTGDMVIATEEGTLELVGRIDQQIKIDGQRVEPNESNFIIQTLPGVSQSCVVSASILNRSVLVALIVPKMGKEWASLVREIRSNLRVQLPPYVIPRYWVQLEEMPLNVSGKADISCLRNIVESMDAEKLIKSSITPPILSPQTSSLALKSTRDISESKIVGIIATVLSIPLATVDAETSFQELGGSSLDAIVVASNLRKIHIHIPVSDILQSASIREMAACRTESKVEEIVPPPFSLLPQGAKLNLDGLEDAYPVTPLQEGILADSILGNASYVYQRIYKLQGVTPSQVRSAMNIVLSRSNILRTIFFPWKRGFLQAVKHTATLPWTLVKGKSLPNFLRESAGIEMPLDEPLIRAAVVEDELLVLEMHHGLFDFWSSQFIIEDTIAILEGRSIIPRLPFSSYVAYQQRTHDDKAKDFWKSYLQSAAPTILDFTTESSRNAEPLVLTSALGNGLAEYSHAHGVTMGAVVHAAWALTLASALGSKDVTFLAAFSGRDADMDGILSLDGPTLCTVPMRVLVDEDVSTISFTKGVQRNLWKLSKFAHTGTRNALANGLLKQDAFNTMVNILVKLPDFLDQSPLVPIVTHGDNFTQ